MDVGQVVDFAIEYNEMHKEEDVDGPEQSVRRATQSDWDALLG